VNSHEDRTGPAVVPADSCAGEPSEDQGVVRPENRDTSWVMTVDEIPVELLVEAPWNANRVSAALLEKIRRSLTEFGIVENLVARPHPEEAGRFEVISGNHRLRLLRELGVEVAPVVLVELDDAEARLLAQTLNRTRGSDDPRVYAQLLEEVLQRFQPVEVTALLPETEASLDQFLRAYRGPGSEEAALPAPGAGPPASRPGEVYELGEHRLLCGDATDPDQVGLLLGDESAALLATDPPYGIKVSHSWRDGLRQPAGSARTATLLNDDRADWADAYRLTDAPVAYVWHGALHAGLVARGLEAAGFELRQQIIWVKENHALSRANYQWRHEPCWYAVRKGAKASWQGGRKQTTVWQAASPIAGFGSGGLEADLVSAHPTQKPLVLFERPILNHTQPGEIVYDPFCGSGTALIAAATHGRRCFAIELDPVWCDLIRNRYLQHTAKTGSV
jgi:DNA modification methylase